jgi:hypothetical protein
LGVLGKEGKQRMMAIGICFASLEEEGSELLYGIWSTLRSVKKNIPRLIYGKLFCEGLIPLISVRSF